MIRIKKPPYISNEDIPDWILALDKSKCIPGKVYNIYKCGNCILDRDADMLRKSRVKFVMKNGISRKKVQCACPERSKFIIKYKICACCGSIIYGTKLSKGKCCYCKNLSKYKNVKLPKFDKIILIKELSVFYRMNKKIESHENLEIKDWENKKVCLNRNKCLEITFIPGNHNVKLGCYKCPDYKPFGI